MSKQLVFGVVGVLLGIVFGMICMMSLHMASTMIYPLPDGVDFMSQEPENQTRLKEWFSALPAGAFLLATLCHALGCLAGAIMAMLVSGRRSLVPAIIVGVFFTLGGVMNLSSVPHPAWFPFVDLPVYLIVATIGGLLLKRKRDEPEAAT